MQTVQRRNRRNRSRKSNMIEFDTIQDEKECQKQMKLHFASMGEAYGKIHQK